MNVVFDLAAADIPSLKRFIARHFHDRYILLNDTFFNWQYRDNPFNQYPNYAMKVLKYQGEVVGYGGMIPVPFNVGDNSIVAGAFANLLIDHKLRGFGFGTLLVKELIKDYPMCYISGYSELLKKLCLKLSGWKELGHLRRMVGVFNRQKLQILTQTNYPFPSLKVSLAKDKDLSITTSFPENIEDLWMQVSSRYGFSIKRDASYLNWRYANHPLISYEILIYTVNGAIKGYLVVRKEKFEYARQSFTVGRIIDLVSEKTSDEALLRAAVTHLSSQNLDFVDFFYSGNVYTRVLQRLGFNDSMEVPFNNIPMLFQPVDKSRKSINIIGYCEPIQPYHLQAYDSSKWYLTKGDGDQDRPNIPQKG